MANAFGALLHRKLPTFSPAPVQSGVSVIQIPTGPTYYAIGLRYKVNGTDCTEAQAKADIKWVRIKINGVTRYEVSGKHLVDVMNKYYGVAFNAGQLYIPLARPWYKTPEGVENTAWGTRNLQSLTLEVEFNTPITSPTLEAYALFSLMQRDLGMIVEVHEFTYTAAASGVQEIPTLPRGNGDLIGLHLDSSLVTSCDLEINQQIFTQGSDISLYQNLVKWYALRQPQTNYTHFDAQIRDLLSDATALINVSDFRVKPTFSGAGTAGIVMETLNTPLGAATPAVN